MDANSIVGGQASPHAYVAPWMIVVAAVVTLPVLCILYNLYFHPLSSFKGPVYFAASEIPLSFLQLRGTSHHALAKAHRRYGSVVRIGPSTLSFIDPSAWHDIYGHRKGRPVLPKDPLFWNETLADKKTLTLSGVEDAFRLRKAMSSAFSQKTLLRLEPMLQGHIDLLMAQLAKANHEHGSVDVRMWFTSSMFDITSDFAFGEDLGCVKTGRYHVWVQNVIGFFYATTLIHQCHKFWPLNHVLATFIPPSVRNMKRSHDQAALQRIRHRINHPKNRPDFMSHFLHNAERLHISMPMIEAQATVVIIAGSQTTATVLIAATYYILADTIIYKTLCEEIRGAFASSDEITLQNVASRLSYLWAVVKETMRIHTPFANGLPRMVPVGGVAISGRWVPQGTVVTISNYCANRSANNFRDPDRFIPERWLGDPAYDGDKKNVVQPFSVGPRDCIGKGLALNHISLTLAHLFWTFDAQLGDGARDWAVGQKIYADWQLPALPVVLSKRK